MNSILSPSRPMGRNPRSLPATAKLHRSIPMEKSQPKRLHRQAGCQTIKRASRHLPLWQEKYCNGRRKGSYHSQKTRNDHNYRKGRPDDGKLPCYRTKTDRQFKQAFCLSLSQAASPPVRQIHIQKQADLEKQQKKRRHRR